MKIKKHFPLFAAAALVFIAAACKLPEVISLTEQDNSTTVNVSLGKKVSVTLEANGTTGFAWQSPVVEGDAVIGTVTHKYIDKPPKNCYGCTNHVRFSFAIVGTGKADLTWLYKRTLEDNETALYTYSVSLVSTE